MIKFKTLLENINILYHVTRYEFAINILKHNYFRTSPGTIGKNGLSTTTDKNYWWGSKEVRFVLDRKKLERDYVLEPVDEKLGIIESEIKVLSNTPIKNAKKYILEVQYFESVGSLYDNFLKKLKKSNLKLRKLGNGGLLENAPIFDSYKDAINWINQQAKEYPSRNAYLASDEYKKIYPKLEPELKRLRDLDRVSFKKDAENAMKEVGISFGDKVWYDFLSSFMAMEKYSGKVVNRNGIPYVKLDSGQKTMDGKSSVRWHKGWKKK